MEERIFSYSTSIAIVLTACGIETVNHQHISAVIIIAIVLTACGIETLSSMGERDVGDRIAIVLTACGIETKTILCFFI